MTNERPVSGSRDHSRPIINIIEQGLDPVELQIKLPAKSSPRASFPPTPEDIARYRCGLITWLTVTNTNYDSLHMTLDTLEAAIMSTVSATLAALRSLSIQPALKY